MKHRLTREFIHIVGRNGNWSEAGIADMLREKVYTEKKGWTKFFDFFPLALGIGFTVSGIIFFFAYNWADMHKFVKMGIIGVLLAGCILFVLRAKASETVKSVVLTGAALLVGALFAVFGQVYQTGADAWQLFFVWTIFIVAWVTVSNFAPLRLIFLVLINTTIVLYQVQLGYGDMMLLYDILFALNAGYVIISEILSQKRKSKSEAGWVLRTISPFAAAVITFAVIVGISDRHAGGPFFVLALMLAMSAFTLGLFYGLKTKNTFYPMVISAAVIAILSALLIKIIDDPITATFIVGVFIIGGIAFSVRQIIRLNKRWHGSK